MANIKPEKAGKGEESVWDYPRPPKAEKSARHLKVMFNGQTVAESNRTVRILETSHPPVYYFPQEDVNHKLLQQSQHTTFCEFKGMASYFHLQVGDKKVENAGWFYKKSRYPEINGHYAFYPSKMEACYINDELVQAQKGDFYGGWITREIKGPFKGGSGTWGW